MGRSTHALPFVFATEFFDQWPLSNAPTAIPHEESIMSTATQSSQYVEFDEYIDLKLQTTRQSMKVADIATALCGIAVAVLSYLLVFAIFDHWVISGGFGYFWRVALLSVLIVGTCWWIGFKVVMPSLRRINQLYAARAIEGISPDLQSNLINLVDLRNAGREVSPLIMRSIEKRAAVSLSHADVEEAVDRQSLLKLLYALVAVVFLFAAYVVFSPKKVGPSIWRALMPTSDVQVATRTQIAKVDPAGAEVPAGTVLEITADLLGDVPTQVVLKYSTADRRVVDRAVEMRLLEDGLKRYRCVLDGERGEGLMQDLDYWVEAGDAHSPSFHVTVIQPPSATIHEVVYDYPKYTLKERETQPSGNVDTLEGSIVTIAATTNMPVKSATLQFSDDDKFGIKGEEKAIKVTDGTRLSVDWKAEFRSDGSFPKYYRIQVRTENGLSDPNPAVQTILLRRDAPPELELVAPKTNMSLFANAIVPILVKARDPDFLLRDVQLFAMKNEMQIFDKVISEPRQSEANVRYEWRLADLNLKAGDEVTMYVAARDNKEPFANRKESQRRVITIIEPGTQKQVDEQLAKDNQKIDEIQQTDQPQNGKRDENDPGAENPDADPKPSSDPRDGDKRNNDSTPDKNPRDDQTNEKRPNQEPMNSKDDEQDNKSDNEKTAPGKSGKKNDSKQNDSQTEQKEDQPASKESDPKGKKTGNRSSQSSDQSDSSNDGAKNDSKSERRPLKNDGSDDADALRKAIERQQQKQKSGDRPPKDGSEKNESSKEKAPNDEKSKTEKPDNAPSDSANNSSDKPEKSDPQKGGEKNSPSKQPNDSPKPEGEAKQDPSNGATENPSSEKPMKASQPNEAGKPEKTSPSSDSTKPNETKSNDSQTTEPKPNNAKGKDESKEPAESSSKKPGQSSDDSKQPNSKEQPASKDPMPASSGSDSKSKDPQKNGEKPTPNTKPDASSSSDPQKATDPQMKDPKTGSSKKDDETSPKDSNNQSPKETSSSKPKSEPMPQDQQNAPSKSSSNDKKSETSKKPDATSSESDPKGNEGSDSKPADGDKKTAKSSDMKNPDGTPMGAASNKKDGSDTQSKNDPKSPKTEGKQDASKNDSETASKSDAKGEAQKGKPGAEKSDSKSKDPMKGSESKNGEKKQDGPKSNESQSDSCPDGSESESKQPGKKGGEGNSKEGTNPQKPKDGGNPAKGAPNQLQSRDGNSDGSSGTAGDASSDPDPVNLDDKKKATNLVLKRLKDELERGDVDQELLKELGWTADDLKRFVDRLDQQSKSGGDTPAEQVRRRQFEEMLKSLDLRSTGGKREDATQKKRSTNDFTDKQVPVPLEYRDALKKYADKLSKQKQPDPKSK